VVQLEGMGKLGDAQLDWLKQDANRSTALYFANHLISTPESVRFIACFVIAICGPIS
jgi:hypothetical protein